MALIPMVIDNKGRALSVVLGNAKLWLRGL